MATDIAEAAALKDQLLQQKLVRTCPECGEDWYSPFDKMFIIVHDRCYECDQVVSSTEADRHANNIFAIL